MAESSRRWHKDHGGLFDFSRGYGGWGPPRYFSVSIGSLLGWLEKVIGRKLCVRGEDVVISACYPFVVISGVAIDFVKGGGFSDLAFRRGSFCCIVSK